MPTASDVENAAARRVDLVTMIATSISANGYPPSVSELAGKAGVSTLTIRRDLAALERAGKIERDPGVARGIRLR
jgi:DeoR/GlpR family transcriptional regulator of sugar metabolism